VQRPATPTGSSRGTKTDQRHGTLHPGSPPLPSCRHTIGRLWLVATRAKLSISAGAEQHGPAPAPTKAPLRSSHWSGRPNNHLTQRVWCLYPGGRVVLASRNSQHAAELGLCSVASPENQPGVGRRVPPPFPARSGSILQIVAFKEDRLIIKP